jgi:hypothetical protein
MNYFTDAANWVCQNPGHSAVIGLLAIAGAALGRRAYKANRASYAPSEKIVNDWKNRPKYTPKFPPHSPRS